MYETVRGELLKMIGELETKKETETLSTRIPELLSHLEAWQQKALISFEGKDIIQLCNEKKHFKLLICFLCKLDQTDLEIEISLFGTS